MEYPEYPIDNRIIFETEVPKDKILKFKGHLHSQVSYYSDNSIRHPAKMDIRMTRWILQHFTKEGETLLDPMSGVGTTVLEAVNMNRNCIAVEYENKFVEWTNENLRLLNRNMAIDKRGSGIVIQGDSRNLTDVLNKQVDNIVFSPPHGSSIGTKAGGRMSWCTKDQSRKALPTYSTSKDNIGNLDYGKDIDTIITSPPFVETIAFQDFGFMEDVHSRDYGNRVRDGKTKGHYASPEAKKRYFEKCEEGKIDNPDNIGNLPKGDIDAIVTSPPHANVISSSKKEFERIKRLVEEGKASKELTRKYNDWLRNKDKNQGCQGHWESRYTDDPDNIGNLPKGEIDTIITSPPFAASPRAGNKDKEAFWKNQEQRHDRKFTESKRILDSMHYSDDPDNIGNLPKGEISAIVTSPPYEGAIESSRHAKSSLAKIKHNVAAYLNFDERESHNIGHKKGKSYISEMLKVYRQCYSALKPGGIAVIVTKNFVRNYKPVRLDIDTLLMMEHCGFTLIDRYFRLLETPSFWIRNYRKQCAAKGVPDPTAHYEDIMIYKKEENSIS